MLKVGLSLLFAAFTVSAQLPTYTTAEPCAPYMCSGDVLNDNGDIAGSVINNAVQYFVVRAGGAIQSLPMPAGFNGYTGIAAINNAGAVVGTVSYQTNVAPYLLGHALAWSPPYSDVLELNPVFHWTDGSSSFVNNHGDIAGNGDTPLPPLIPGVTLEQVWAITDDGNVIGTLSDQSTFASLGATALVIFTPGVATDRVPGFGRVFNNRGQVASTNIAPPGYPASASYSMLYTPGKGLTSLPTISAAAINDNGIILGGVYPNTPVIYDSSGSIPALSSEPVSLLSLLPADWPWQIQSVVAINNSGQILALATPTQPFSNLFTTILLTPSIPLDSLAKSSAIRTEKDSPRRTAPSCPVASLNGVNLRSCPPR